MSTRDRPLLPVKNRLESFWLDKRDPALCDARTTPDLPKSADIVIVGSGMAGAMTSYFLYEEAKRRGRSPPRIVMLEADETCGSSTARNGGHIKPVTFLGYNKLKAKHGKETANALLELEETALGIYGEVVEKEKIDCDLHVTRSIDIFFDKADAEACRKDLEARTADWPDRHGDARAVGTPAEIEKIAGVKGAIWSASQPGGHLWPYLLATALIKIGIRQGMNLQTYTPVTSIESKTPTHSIIKTSRGDISATLVIAASNAYTASFLPDFRSKIIPIRGTASSIRPAQSHSLAGNPGPLKYTYGFRHGTGDVDYLIPRQGRTISGRGDNSIILGGAKSTFLKHHERWYNNINDNEEMPGARKYFEDFMPKNFVGWNGDAGNVEKVWSGVLGYSSDFNPYIGLHPERKGIMLCAGFTGHGMPLIPTCSIAVASLAIEYLGGQGKISPKAQKAFEAKIPKPFRLTQQRYDTRVNVIKEFMGQEGGAGGALVNTDEAVILARAKLAKL